MTTEFQLPDLVHIPAGPFVMGEDHLTPAEAPAHIVELPAFDMARHPVTNQEYMFFLAAQGYNHKMWWSEDGWRWVRQKRVTGPAFWGTKEFGGPAQPVVGVSWYEAQAYSRWLSTCSGRRFHLPTEAQWEKAARAGDDRLWPWGRLFDAWRCNTAQGGLGRPNDVNAYPGGANPYGLRCCAGNVWEWTRNRWGRAWQTLQYPYPYNPADGREDESGRFARVMRGASWFDPPQEARLTNRGRYLPGSRGSNIGFRLVADD